MPLDDLDVQCLPYMPLQVERLRKSKAWLRCKRKPELAFYMVNLWMRAWHEVPAGSIEDDDDVLADASMASPNEWERLKDDIMLGWERRNGRVWHSTVTEIATDSAGKLRKNRSRTAAARQALAEARFPSVTDAVTANAESATGYVTDAVTDDEGKRREGKGIESTSDDVDTSLPTNRYVFQASKIRLTEADLEKWRKAFPHLALEAELWSLDEWAGRQGKRWFAAVSGALAKKEREAIERAAAAREKRDASGRSLPRREGRI
ncbi:DUF1376 domain-containing protein [Neorhizobium petrolearium]|uniref:DUF1376 domain-containing protein n=1 Tax=Neorhizobium petrolearium TaxID=515361 RepID=UPI003F18917A